MTTWMRPPTPPDSFQIQPGRENEATLISDPGA